MMDDQTKSASSHAIVSAALVRSHRSTGMAVAFRRALARVAQSAEERDFEDEWGLRPVDGGAR